MWKIPVLLLVLGSASFWIAAEGASTARPEDDIVTTGVEDGMNTAGAEDNIVTTVAYESTSVSSLVTTSTAEVTDIPIEDQPTTDGTTHDHEGSQSTTTSTVATSQSTDKGDDTEVIIEKDGMATVTLIGIIVGVLLAIGFIGGIIFVVVRKMSGRYSP